jgi:hypothetical protein
MAKKRTPPLSVFIACEGSNTEPLYFEKLNEIMEDEDNYPYAITVYPDKEVDDNPKTDAIGLINVAIERKEDFDELWVVFDKDGYTKHKEAFELAEENKINIAFSSISFETWVLLHFERNHNSFAKSASIINEKFHNNDTYLSDYAKSGDYNVYPKIQTKTKKAFENASWLRNWLNTNNHQYTIYEVNPYTDIDFLVKKLILDHFVYEYKELGQSLIFNGVEIIVSNVNGEYVVNVTNSTNRSLVWNEFVFYDVAKNKINVNNSIILVGNNVQTSLGRIAESQKIFVEFQNLKLEVDGVALN